MKDYKKYVKVGLHKDFEDYCKNNSLDFYSCGVVLTGHLVLEKLMQHENPVIVEKTGEIAIQHDKVTPEEAWEYAMEATPYHSGTSVSFCAMSVFKYYPRGDEFKEWAKKSGNFMINFDEE